MRGSRQIILPNQQLQNLQEITKSDCKYFLMVTYSPNRKSITFFIGTMQNTFQINLQTNLAKGQHPEYYIFHQSVHRQD